MYDVLPNKMKMYLTINDSCSLSVQTRICIYKIRVCELGTPPVLILLDIYAQNHHCIDKYNVIMTLKL